MKIRNQVLLFIGAFLLVSGAVSLYYYFQTPPGLEFQKQFYTDGYNFRKYRDGEKDFRTYQAGETIDLSKLQTSGGDRLLDTSSEDLLLLVAVDPMCPFTKMSTDIIAELKQSSRRIHVGYYPVMFVDNSKNVDLDVYAGELGFEHIYRGISLDNFSEHFRSMPTPAHILTDRQGTVLQVWFSSDKNPEVRKRMGSQLSYELFLINDVYKVIHTGKT
jgi:hypothetical protein